jgi:guanylate kinase
MISNDEFLEYERYGSYYYGTSKKELERDDFIVLDLEVNGATKLLTSNDSYIGIFIDIDDNVLIERLNERGHDDQFIEERMNLAKEQRQSMGNFDYIIKNIDLKATIKEILDILYDLEKK